MPRLARDLENGVLTHPDCYEDVQRVSGERQQAFKALFVPERQRLLRAMNDAIHRMVAIAYDDSE